ncbi:MAG: 1-deoxy-D-xylulose-5-phosphate reductoisomerase [Kiritimatiellae bacterium]|nr:1-deoxy-D-xylulose-5-phosphate reductoisomerase [Kiritimatiellia bacterium]
MKNIILLGSTGSIGESCLRVVEALPTEFRIVGLAANHSYKRLIEQAEQFNVSSVAVADAESARLCAEEIPSGVELYVGEDGVEQLTSDADIVVCAIVGMAGLRPVLSAVTNGIDVALATKEVLVSAGKIVMTACAESGAKILPVDSEHSAIFQCLAASAGNPVTDSDLKRIILTASGGPFLGKPDIDLDNVTVEEVLNHPRWDMGKKVTVDSATLMNKGLEIMEAHWLFDVPIENIDVVVHPESIVHSMVEFVDGNVLAQMSLPDMRFAIQYALTWPERLDGGLPVLDILKTGSLHFETPDEDRFPCLELAREAGRIGGSMPAVLNAANEVAVHSFLDGKISFPGIWRIVRDVMDAHKTIEDPDLDAIMEADAWARNMSERMG